MSLFGHDGERLEKAARDRDRYEIRDLLRYGDKQDIRDAIRYGDMLYSERRLVGEELERMELRDRFGDLAWRLGLDE